VYFTIYSTLALTVVSAIKLSGASFINQTIITNKQTTLIKLMLFASLLSLGGVPPSPLPWIPAKVNCYSSHYYKQYGAMSNSRGSNIINYPILLPKNHLLKFYNPKHRAKTKLKVYIYIYILCPRRKGQYSGRS
jgi:hypothetical protein